MSKQKKNKKRGFLKVLIILGLCGLIITYILTVKVKNIYIVGNNLLKDQEVIELANLENYPKLFKISSYSLKNKIKLNQYVKDVRITKSLFGKITIYIEEYNVLLKNDVDNTMYLSNFKKIPNDNQFVGIPSLINATPDDILKSFLEKLDKIDKTILTKISEIEYRPNEYDKDLFLFYMNDGNYVYITTTRLNNINKYDEVLLELDGKKGIIYLDSGNHFQAFE